MVRYFLCLFLVIGIAGCGYSTGSLLPSKYHKIAVQPFQNKVNFINENYLGNYVPLLETNVRTAIIDKFLFDGNLHIADPDKADLVLSGDLIGFTQDNLRQDVNQNIQQYRLRITVALTMKDMTTGKILWQEPNFSGETTYYLSGSQAQTQSGAIDTALDDLATRIVERTVENW
jgi:Lipopolysaccharide-assembly